MDIDFVGGSYRNRFIGVDAEECINWYVEHIGQPADPKSPKVLMPTPGLRNFLTLRGPVGATIRGFHVSPSGRAYAVFGNILYELLSTGKTVSRGTLLTSSGHVSMADNGLNQDSGRGLILVDGVNGYMLNMISNVFYRIQSPIQVVDNTIANTITGVTALVAAMVAAFLPVTNGKTFQLAGVAGVVWDDTTDDVLLNAKRAQLPESNIGPGDVFVYYASNGSNPDRIYFVKSYVDTSGNAIWPLSTTPTIAPTDATTAATLPEASCVKFLDGFFIIQKTNTGEFYISQSYDGSNWDQLDYATAEGSPDNLVGIEVIHDQLLLFANTHTEIWYDAGQQFPFQRISGALIQVGCMAPFSICTNGDTAFWLGGSVTGHGQVWAMDGMQPTKISIPSIDHIIESLPNIQDAVGFSYTQEGHKFYAISFQQGNKTLCYDMTTGEWHERAYWNKAAGRFERHRAQYSGFCFGLNLVTDYGNGSVYYFDETSATDDGAIIRRVRTGPQVHHDRKRIFFDTFEIDIQRGIGTTAGQGQNPEATLFWSDDGGFTWSNGYAGSVGAMGQYKVRLRWNRLGMSRDRVFKLVLSDPVNTAIIGARADLRIGVN